MLKRLLESWKYRRSSTPSEPAPASPFIRKGSARVSVGLDFGTHSTKVSHAELGVPARSIRPVRFGHGLAEWPDWVIPAVGVLSDNGLTWGATAARTLEHLPWNRGIRRLKVLLAASADPAFADPLLSRDLARERDSAPPEIANVSVEALAIVALVAQILEVRARLRQDYQGRTLEPQFTIPVPIDQVQNSVVLANYHRIINAVQAVLRVDGALTVAPGELLLAAESAFASASPELDPDGWLFTLPEAVAQMACYVRSLEAAPGVYAVVDIGAGTTDLSIFALRPNHRRELEYFWYSAQTIPKATAFVYRAVLDHSGNKDDSLSESELMRLVAGREGAVADALERIRHAGNPAWTVAYKHHMGQERWEGCPVFLCGGGSELNPTRRVFRRCYVRQWRDHDIRELPVPRDYIGGPVPFKRMATAYGLAIPGPEHGNPVLPNDAPDHTPPRIVREFEGAGGDQLTPTPSWVR